MEQSRRSVEAEARELWTSALAGDPDWARDAPFDDARVSTWNSSGPGCDARRMWEEGLSGWRPEWRSGSEQRDRVGPELRALVGRRITATWVVWDAEDDSWFSDAPVLLVFDGGRQLELCWQKFDDLSVTWGTVDLAAAPSWFDRPLAWRRDALPVLRRAAGATVTDLAWTEHTMVIGRSRWWRRDGSVTWLVGGLWIGTDTGGLLVYDGLDENRLTGDLPTPGPEHRIHSF